VLQVTQIAYTPFIVGGYTVFFNYRSFFEVDGCE